MLKKENGWKTREIIMKDTNDSKWMTEKNSYRPHEAESNDSADGLTGDKLNGYN